MGLELKGVDVFETIPGSHGQTRLVRRNPYVRLCRKGDPPVYVQGGVAYSEGGQRYEPLPEWFADEMGKLSADVKAAIRWTDEGVQEKSPAPPEPAAPAKMWTCPEATCGATMPTTKKGIHIAKHRREGK